MTYWWDLRSTVSLVYLQIYPNQTSHEGERPKTTKFAPKPTLSARQNIAQSSVESITISGQIVPDSSQWNSNKKKRPHICVLALIFRSQPFFFPSRSNPAREPQQNWTSTKTFTANRSACDFTPLRDIVFGREPSWTGHFWTARSSSFTPCLKLSPREISQQYCVSR